MISVDKTQQRNIYKIESSNGNFSGTMIICMHNRKEWSYTMSATVDGQPFNASCSGLKNFPAAYRAGLNVISEHLGV